MSNKTVEQVTCNECEEMFNLPKTKRTVHPNLIYEFYFNCPHCNHKYISYFTDKKIRRDINRQKKRWKKYQTVGTREMRAEINMQDKLVKKDMDGLYERMESI